MWDLDNTPLPDRAGKPGILTGGELRAITVPALLITGARSALITPAQARDRASLMPHAQVAIVPGSHGGFNRINERQGRHLHQTPATQLRKCESRARRWC